MTDNPKPGPTGDFPEGMLGPNDEGGLNIGIVANAKDGQVYIQFGGKVSWLAVPPDTAIQFAVGLIGAATKLLEANAMGPHEGEA